MPDGRCAPEAPGAFVSPGPRAFATVDRAARQEDVWPCNVNCRLSFPRNPRTGLRGLNPARRW